MSDAVLVALIVGLFGTITSIIGLFGILLARSTHTLINSRMTELLEAARATSRAEGHAEGEQAQRDRTAEPQTPADLR